MSVALPFSITGLISNNFREINPVKPLYIGDHGQQKKTKKKQTKQNKAKENGSYKKLLAIKTISIFCSC